jgi:hypothetical protein
MSTLIHADIFFFLTSIFVGVLIIGAIIIIVLIIPILRDVRDLSRMVKNEGERIVNDIDELRDAVDKRKRGVQTILSYVAALITHRSKIRNKKM